LFLIYNKKEYFASSLNKLDQVFVSAQFVQFVHSFRFAQIGAAAVCE